MKEISHFSGSNLSQETNGIRATSTSATTLLYNKTPFKIEADTSYALILSLESDNNYTITFAFLKKSLKKISHLCIIIFINSFGFKLSSNLLRCSEN